MELSEICVATIMRSRSAQEEQTLRGSLQALSRLQLPVIVADGGSPPELVEYVAALPGMTVVTPPRQGLVSQIKASLGAAYAAGRRFILYTEPDKAGFFENGLLELIRGAPDTGEVGVVLASRSDESFATFSPLQRFTESTINRLTGEALGQRGDYSYGPFVLDRTLVHCLEQLPDEVGWGWRHFLFATAHRLGHAVLFVTGDFPCPPDQHGHDDEERLHRLRQLSQNIDGLTLATQGAEQRI